VSVSIVFAAQAYILFYERHNTSAEEVVRPAKTSSNKIDLVSSDDEDGGGSRSVTGLVDLVADDDEGCEGDGLRAVVSDEDIRLFNTVSGA
jgi:hypothetical protein